MFVPMLDEKNKPFRRPRVACGDKKSFEKNTKVKKLGNWGQGRLIEGRLGRWLRLVVDQRWLQVVL